ncbi:Hypothetical predicted protein, partial [Mytilus galloprovincialis]
MSLTQWLKTGSVKTRTPVTPGLPDPADCISTQDALIVQTANDAVDTVVSAPSRKRKRGDYINYDEETRAKIARYAVDNGVARASRKFTSDLGRKVSETTIRSMRDTYVKLKKKGNFDTKVQDWIQRYGTGCQLFVNKVIVPSVALCSNVNKKKMQVAL